MPTNPLLRILAIIAYLAAVWPLSAGTLSLGASGAGTLTLSSEWTMQYDDSNLYAPNVPITGVGTIFGGSLTIGSGNLGLGESSFVIIGAELSVGNGTIDIGGGNNLPPIPRVTTQTLNLGRSHAFLFYTSSFASDPDSNPLRIVAVEGGSADWEIRQDGTELLVIVSQPGEVRVTIEDSRGGRCVGTAKFTVWDAMRRYVTGYEERLVFDVPTFNFPTGELTVEIVNPATAGQATLVSPFRIEYTGAGDRMTNDSFRFLVKRSGEMVADLTGMVVNVGDALAGRYQLESQTGRHIGRVTVQSSGAYTAVLHSPSGSVRRQGNFLTEAPSATPADATGLRFNATETQPGIFHLTASLHLPSGIEGVSCHDEAGLGRLRAPQVNALLRNRSVRVQIVMLHPGAFVEVARTVTNLPSSYAIIRKGAGASVTFVGRHFDGTPWTGAGFIHADGSSLPNGLMPFVGRGMSGSLKSHRNGNVTGTIRGDLPNKGPFVVTLGGSPFKPKASTVNALNGQRTPVRIRSLFPVDISLPSFVEASGRVAAEGPSGLRVEATIDRADGTVSGMVNAGAINVKRPINGLFIPHLQSVVGFTGDEVAKPLTIQRR